MIHPNLRYCIYAKFFYKTIVIYDLRDDFVDSYLHVNTRKWAYLQAFYNLRVNKKSPYVKNLWWNPPLQKIVITQGNPRLP